jgi:integrase
MAKKNRTPGISTHTTKNGRVSYRLKFYVPDPLATNGLRQKLKTFDKQADAVAFKEKLRTQIRSGDYQADVDLTVQQLAEKYLAVKKLQIDTGSYLLYDGYVRNHILKIGHIKATKLTTADVEQAASAWAQVSSHKLANNVLARLSAIYKFGRKLGIKNNPVVDVERLRSQVTLEEMEAEALGNAIPDRGGDNPDEGDHTTRTIQPHEVYSALELRKLVEAAEGVDRVMLMTLVFCGLRHGEMLGLRWVSVDLRKGELVVNRSLKELPKRLGGKILGRPKTKNSYRRIKIAPPLLQELKKLKLASPPNQSDLVFVDEIGRPRGYKHTYKIMSETCNRAGIRTLHIHSLRHSFASQSLLSGVPPLRVSKLMGHKNVSITLTIYSHWADLDESDAEDRLASRIFSAQEAVDLTGSEEV